MEDRMPTPNRRIRTLAAGALALALGTTALTPFVFPAEAQPAASTTGTAIALPRPAGPDFADLAARVGPAVVRVTFTGHAEAQQVADLPPELRGTPFERFFQQQQQRQGGAKPRRTMGQGSGF